MHSEPCPFIPVQIVKGLTCNLCHACGRTLEYHTANEQLRKLMRNEPLPEPTRKELELCGAAIESFEKWNMHYAPQPPKSEYPGLQYVAGE